MSKTTDTLSAAPPRAAAQPRIDRQAALAVLAILALALLPRLLGLRDFITIDEVAHWIDRTQRFSDGLGAGRLVATHQTGHPGVTLMWLASAGLWAERLALAQGWASAGSQLDHLAWLRAPAALLQALIVPLGYLLLRRLVRPATALAAALLWATSPYLVAHGRLLHLDGLLASFVTLSVLCLLVALPAREAHDDQDARWISLPFLAGSGVCAGLAVLTKAPALILLPAAGLLLLWRLPAASFLQRLWRASASYAAWLGLATLTVVLLFPALWVAPGRVVHSYIEEIVDNGGRPNGAGQFFLGRAIDDPGPLFYLVSSALRTTPTTLLGLVLLLGCTMYDVRCTIWRPDAVYRSDRRGAAYRSERVNLAALALFALLWFVVMTLGPKKFDRYVLPAWPAIEILAAAGIVGLRDLCRPQLRAGASRLGALLLTALAVGTLAFYHPYYLSYYNPLLGGGQTAQRALLIGWGEGMDKIGAYLSARPDIGYGPVLSALAPTLKPFVPVPVKPISELDQGTQNYAVVYLESIQRGADAAVYDSIRRTLPLARISIHGIDYALIYQLPKPFKQALPAQFGDALHLWGVTLKEDPDQITLTPAWDVRAAPGGDYHAFLHLIDASGRQVAQIDLPPGGGETPPTSAWQPGQQIAVPLPLTLPPDLAPGSYQLTLGLYDPATGARLPLRSGPAADPASAGRDALLVATITR